MAITGVVARVRVDDLEASCAFYERLCDAPARRFSFGDADLASVGPFLLICAEGEIGERLARATATIAVDDLPTQAAQLKALGAEVLADPAATPNGSRMVARHPDGAVFEYVGPR